MTIKIVILVVRLIKDQVGGRPICTFSSAQNDCTLCIDRNLQRHRAVSSLKHGFLVDMH